MRNNRATQSDPSEIAPAVAVKSLPKATLPTVDLGDYIADDGLKRYKANRVIRIYTNGKMQVSTDFVRDYGLFNVEWAEFYYRKNHSLLVIFREEKTKRARKITWHKNGSTCYINTVSLFNRFKIDVDKVYGSYQALPALTTTGDRCYRIYFSQRVVKASPEADAAVNGLVTSGSEANTDSSNSPTAATQEENS